MPPRGFCRNFAAAIEPAGAVAVSIIANERMLMKTNMNFDLFTPTRLLFGRGKLNELGDQKMPGKKALLLISNGN